MMNKALAVILMATGVLPAMAQLNITTTMTPQQLVQNVLVGGGVTVSNVTYNSLVVSTPQDGTGSFTNGNTTNLGLTAGLILSSGLATSAAGNASDFGSDILSTGSDPDLVDITTPGNDINDRAVLEFDFIPTGDSLKFNYVFGSEEYPDYNCNATFNDVFGFFLSGPGITGPYTNNAANIALVPGTTLPVSIANIHGSEGFGCPPANEAYYMNNSAGTTIALNGFTTVLQARAAVICGETYHIKLAIGDAGDQAYNSAVFLQAGSFQSNILPTVSASTFYGDATAAEGCQGGRFTIFRPPGIDTTYTVGYYFTGTATPGADFSTMPGTAVIPEGQDSVNIPFDAIEDGLAEGIETALINVFMVNACGDTISTSAMIAIVQYPQIILSTDTALLLNCDQDSIPLFASVSGGFGSVTMAWGDTLETSQIWVSGIENGTYTVSAWDQCPQTVTATIVVDANCVTEVVIPNVITPNGDGENDKFVVEGLKNRENEVQIWDRWGKEVYKTRNYQNNFSANSLSDGVYFYWIRVEEDEFTGHLQVLGNK